MLPLRFPITNLLLIPFFILIAAGLILPSDGKHGLTNIKSLIFVLCFFCTGCYAYIKQKFTIPEFKLLTFLGFTISLLLLWVSLGIVSDQIPLSSQFDQLKIFLTTIIFVIITLYFYEEKKLKFPVFFKTVVYTNFAYSLAKVTALAMHLLQIIDIYTLMEKTGLKFMTMSIYGQVSRMQTSADIITPFLIFFVLQSGQFGVSFSRKFKFIYLIISAISIILSFSRVFIGIALLGIFLYWLTTNFSRWLKSLLICFLIVTGALVYFGTQPFESLIQKRFNSESSQESDNTRDAQIRALMKEHEESPFFGKGIGSYSKEMIRDSKNPHSYEVQWIAFLMQFGIIGILCMLIPVGYIYLEILKHPISRMKVAVVVLFTCWILAGFTNPFVISLTSGIIYALFILAALSLQRDKITSKADLH
jgi:hypothetical protein